MLNLIHCLLLFWGASGNVHQVLPHVGIGTAGLRSQTRDIVRKSLELGVRLIDTAQAAEWYSEKGCGEGISDFISSGDDHRRIIELVVVTKIHPRSFELNKMRSKLVQSRELLRTDLDVVLLHSPRCWPNHCTQEEMRVSWQTGWMNLENLKQEHDIKLIGVSNFDISEMETLVKMSNKKVGVVQNWIDPLHQDREVREFCKEHQIEYMGYSSFGTQWLGRFAENPVLNHPTLTELAGKHNVSVTQLILQWLRQLGVVAIPRSSRPEHLEENFASLTGTVDFELTGADMREIELLDGSMGAPWDS